MTGISSGGVPTWLTALIAGLAVVLGAGATAFATVLAANCKVNEVELTYQQRIKENYLENARAYTQGVYMPLATALTRLAAAFGKYQSELETSSESSSATTIFFDAIASFREAVEDLQERGAAAFLTTALEGEIEDFIAFLEASRETTRTKRRAIVQFSAFGIALERNLSSVIAIEQARIMSSLRYLPAPLMPRITMLKDRIVAADPQSEDFRRAFVISTSRLRILIKEVTLGAHASR